MQPLRRTSGLRGTEEALVQSLHDLNKRVESLNTQADGQRSELADVRNMLGQLDDSIRELEESPLWYQKGIETQHGLTTPLPPTGLK